MFHLKLPRPLRFRLRIRKREHAQEKSRDTSEWNSVENSQDDPNVGKNTTNEETSVKVARKKIRGRKDEKPTNAHSCVEDNVSKVFLLDTENFLVFFSFNNLFTKFDYFWLFQSVEVTNAETGK